MATLPRQLRDMYLGGKKLSPREKQVLRLAADGLTYNEIGARLSISPETCKSHAQNAMSKLEARNTTHAVVKAMSYGDI